MRPDAVRASRIPTTTPLVTRPTTRPRRSAGASDAAKATSVCVTTARSPIAAMLASRIAEVRAVATAASATTRTSSWVTMRRLRSATSPSGTRKKSPSPYPTCVRVTTLPTSAGLIARSWPTVTRSGWAK